jgi:hypothetical protein
MRALDAGLVPHWRAYCIEAVQRLLELAVQRASDRRSSAAGCASIRRSNGRLLT